MAFCYDNDMRGNRKTVFDGSVPNEYRSSYLDGNLTILNGFGRLVGQMCVISLPAAIAVAVEGK